MKKRGKLSDPASFRPSEFMRSRRPELYSDSRETVRPHLTPEVFEYHLDTLTNRKQETQFEYFGRRLAEKEICPNLIPQTGPTGGGDSKVDTETYPVADVIALRWYEGIGREASQERWAFAISAKKKWSSKLRSDIAKIAETNRGYKLIGFITNQFVADKKRAALEDELSKKHGAQVRIFDRSWIMKAVFEHKRVPLAVETLGLSEYNAVSDKVAGPKDAKREAQLAELDAEISDPERYRGVPYQLAEDCLQAALLARGLERPEAEIDSRFDRAERIAKESGNNQQELRIVYNRAWTKFFWHDDLGALNRLYDSVEGLAAATLQFSDMELVCNLWQLLRSSVTRGMLAPADAKLAERTLHLREELKRLGALQGRQTTALQSRSALLMMDLTEAIEQGDAGRIDVTLSGLKTVLQEAESHVNFPIEPLTTVIQELGDVLVDSAVYDDLFEVVVSLLNRRSSEGTAGITLLGRGIQKLNGGRRYEAIRLFGRAQQKLALHEYREEHVTALAGCAQAYEAAGLIWAARANVLLAANQALAPLWEEGRVLPQALVCVKKLVWLELQLGRITYALDYLRTASAVAGALNLGEERRAKFLEEREAQDRILGMLFLKSELKQLTSLGHVPQLLMELELPHAWLALLYVLRYEDFLREDGWIPPEETEDTVREFFKTWRDRPADDDLPDRPELLAPGEISLNSVVLGCKITVRTAANLVSLQIGETIAGALEAFLSTSLSGGVAPYRSRFLIRVEPFDAIEKAVDSNVAESEEGPVLIVRHRLPVPDQAVGERDWLVDQI
jgi:hypothetical protein